MLAKKFDRDLLVDCAKELLSFLALQDPMFEERIEITRSEYRLDDLQVALLYMSRTLDLGEHMWFSERAFLNPGYSGHCGPRACDICGNEFSTSVAASTTCSQPKCLAEAARRADEAFEKRSVK